uniref:SMB domain-containing protein n=1 Tax=Branchiostoma floridae TaxID=7739 RepID=C3Y5A5_BRAFL|eukprot:XP_002608628.1 hypothetical protein BRAFLDRAFT_96165 [Branchiostoma floridae]
MRPTAAGGAARSLSGILVLLMDPCQKDNCTGRCGSWKNTHTCQCDVSCRTFSDCCDDYEDVCRHQESAARTNVTTVERVINTYSCQWRCNDDVPAHGALCFCNASCLDMANCCEDYQEVCVKRDPDVWTGRQLMEGEPLQCIAIEPPNMYNIHNYYWMVASCPTSFPRNKVRMLCEEKRSFDEDPLVHQPILSTTSSGRTSYKNVFCAVCNNATSLMGWKAVANCRRFVPSFKKALRSDRCSVEFQEPKESKARKCFPATSLSSISPSCEHAEKCKGAPVPVVHVDVMRKSFRSFRNIFCAKCTLGDLFNQEVVCDAEIKNIDIFISSLALIIDYSEVSKTVVTKKVTFHSQTEIFPCPPGEIFDPFLEICRKVVHVPPSGLLPADTTSEEEEKRGFQLPPIFPPLTPCYSSNKQCKGLVTTLTPWHVSGNRMPLTTETVLDRPQPKVSVDSLTELPRVVTAGWAQSSSVTAEGRHPTFPTSTVLSDTTPLLFKHVRTSYDGQANLTNGLASTLSPTTVAEETSFNLKESTFVAMHSSSYALVVIFLIFMATRKCGRHLPRNVLEINLIVALAINQTSHFIVKIVPGLMTSKVVAVGSLHLLLVCELCTSAVIRHLHALASNKPKNSRNRAREVGYILTCWFCPGTLMLLNLGNGIRYTPVAGCFWVYQISPPVWAVLAMIPAAKLYHFLRLICACVRHTCRPSIPVLVEATCLFSVSALVSSLVVVTSLLPTPLALSALSAVLPLSSGTAALVVIICRSVAPPSDSTSPDVDTEIPNTNRDTNTVVLLSVKRLDDING